MLESLGFQSFPLTAYVLPLRELFGLADVPWAHHKADIPVPTTKEENSGIHKITAFGLRFPGLELQRSFFSDNMHVFFSWFTQIRHRNIFCVSKVNI